MKHQTLTGILTWMMQHIIITELWSIQYQLREQLEVGMNHHTKPVRTESQDRVNVDWSCAVWATKPIPVCFLSAEPPSCHMIDKQIEICAHG